MFSITSGMAMELLLTQYFKNVPEILTRGQLQVSIGKYVLIRDIICHVYIKYLTISHDIFVNVKFNLFNFIKSSCY